MVKLYVKRACDNGKDGRCVAVCCAVCDDMREDLILTSSIIGKLGALPVNAVTTNSSPRDEDRHDRAVNMDGHLGFQGSTADNIGQGPVDNDSNGANYNMPRPPVDQNRDGKDGGETDAAITPGGTVADDGTVNPQTPFENSIPQTNNSHSGHSVSTDEYDADGFVVKTDASSALGEKLRVEQKKDKTLKGPWKLASKGSGNFFVKNGMFYHKEMILG